LESNFTTRNSFGAQTGVGRHFPLGFMVTASISNKRSCGYARLKEDTSMIKMAAMFLRNSLYNQSVGIDNRRWWLDQRIDNLVLCPIYSTLFGQVE
jgi:hypothetical protein